MRCTTDISVAGSRSVISSSDGRAGSGAAVASGRASVARRDGSAHRGSALTKRFGRSSRSTASTSRSSPARRSASSAQRRGQELDDAHDRLRVAALRRDAPRARHGPGSRRSADPGPARRGAPGGQPRHRADGVGQPHDLRAVLRPAARRDPPPGRRAARVRAALRPARLAGRSALRRHEAPAHDRAGAHQPARGAAPRRADHRSRPAGPAHAVGASVPPEAERRHARAHDALHGRGRAALRPARDHGRRPDRRRGLAARAGRRARDARGGGAALRARVGAGRRAGPRPRLASRVEPVADRLLVYTDDGDRTAAAITGDGVGASSVLVRRASLEDVFLILTGRTLEE